MVVKEKLKPPTDPFYCPKCGKNTEDEDKKFSQGFKSGDDIAAYNIARLGLDYYKKQKNKKPMLLPRRPSYSPG